MPRLLTDTQSAAAIQAIELDSIVTVTIGLTSSSYSLNGVSLVRVALSEDCWIKFVKGAGGTVSSSDGHYFPKGVEVFVVPRSPQSQWPDTYIAIISASGQTGYGSLTAAK